MPAEGWRLEYENCLGDRRRGSWLNELLHAWVDAWLWLLGRLLALGHISYASTADHNGDHSDDAPLLQNSRIQD